MKKLLSIYKKFSIREKKKQIESLKTQCDYLKCENLILSIELKFLQKIEAEHEEMIKRLNELQKINENCINKANERLKK